jgi:DHA2 family multidrug resistance protein
MGAPPFAGPFRMPMYRKFVPEAIRPWFYVLFAIAFQLTGGVYLGSLDELIGSRSVMREDVTMCLYANLTGMAIYFPLLFRMKFRFTNKTLLLTSSIVLAVCNIATMYVRDLPTLWAVCFIAGCFKLQGTFECISNIQLWITPKRDFRVFFPVLHLFILGSIQLSSILATYISYYYHWTFMHLFIAGLMLTVALMVMIMTKHVRIMRKFPLYGVDWLGALLWALLFLEITFFFNYGDWYDWWNSLVMRWLAVVAVVTLVGCVHRMLHIRHPFYSPQMWKYKYLFSILLLITVVEAIMATEHVLEEIFYADGLKYSELTTTVFDWCMLAGVLVGCLFSLLWLKVWQQSYLRLIAIGFFFLICYLTAYYFLISPDINMEKLYLPTFCKGFGYAILALTIMFCLEEQMTFEHFFQGLSVFNMLHMMVGGVIGSAIYATNLRHLMTDNIGRYSSYIDDVTFSRAPFDLGRYMDGFIDKMLMISVKQIYGIVSYTCIVVLFVILLYDMPRVRRTFKSIPGWKTVGKQVRSTIWRLRN